MNTKRSIALTLQAACAAASIGLGMGVAAADELGQITIGAGQLTKTVVGRSPSTGAAIEDIVLTRHVNYSDVDLGTRAGALELENRVKSVARAACELLAGLYPPTERDSADCTKQATEDAMVQVRVAIAAAAQRERG